MCKGCPELLVWARAAAVARQAVPPYGSTPEPWTPAVLRKFYLLCSFFSLCYYRSMYCVFYLRYVLWVWKFQVSEK
jgi:hypothetical protein